MKGFDRPCDEFDRAIDGFVLLSTVSPVEGHALRRVRHAFDEVDAIRVVNALDVCCDLIFIRIEQAVLAKRSWRVDEFATLSSETGWRIEVSDVRNLDSHFLVGLQIAAFLTRSEVQRCRLIVGGPIEEPSCSHGKRVFVQCVLLEWNSFRMHLL